MTFLERLGTSLRPAVFLSHNPVTLTGAVLTTSSALTLIGFWLYEITGSTAGIHPYAGILFFLVLPGIFVFGLVLIPVGAWRHHRRLRAAGQLPETWPKIDLRSPLLLRGLALVSGATLLNVVLLGTATYRGVEYMDSATFCGQTCHSVMEPEFTAYSDSPHSRVGCVQCHIGPGAPWFVRSKISGVRQVFAVTFNTHSRPIPSPVKHLRPARETCEQCHWPQKFHGDKFLVRTSYASDEANTASTTVLVLKIGGRTWQGATGIHGRHLDTIERISYVATDERRQVIARVTYLDDKGQNVTFDSSEINATPAQLAAGEHRKMDCMDCHNRPTHTFQMPEKAVDQAMSSGTISLQLPFIKKLAVEQLRADYPDRATATAKMESAITDFYRSRYPGTYRDHRAWIQMAVQQVQAIYSRNIFPGMKITWGTYPSNIGHFDFPGCFRCHDGNHKSSDGRVITQDCSACHNILAMDEKDPKVLIDLGLK